MGKKTKVFCCFQHKFSKSGQRPHRRVSAVPPPTPIGLVNTRARTKRRDLWFQSKHAKLGLLYTIGQCSLHHLSWPAKNSHSWLTLFRGAAANSRPQWSDGTCGWKPSLLSTQVLRGHLLRRSPQNCWTLPQGAAGCTKALASPDKSRAAKNRAGKEFRRCQDAILPKKLRNHKITSPVMYKNNRFGRASCEYIYSFTLCCYYYTCYSPLVMKSICLLFPSFFLHYYLRLWFISWLSKLVLQSHIGGKAWY